MTLHTRTVTIFGGAGFIGAQIVRLLAKKGWRIKIVSRVPERAFFLKPCGAVGQIVPLACDYSDPDSIAKTLKGSDFAINCIGALYERRRARFSRVHVDIPQKIAQACTETGVQRLVHLSALGCDKGVAQYAKTKREGEEAVRAAFPAVTILRPSVIFGPDDDFFNMLAEMARYFPALPLVGGGHTKFEPVYVGDVAQAVLAALCLPAGGDHDPQGKTFELGGPEVLTFREICERLSVYTGRQRRLVSLPWGLAKLEAAFLGMLPRPPLTRDQVELLKTDNIVSEGALTLESLGITPTGMSLIVPSYLASYRPGGRPADKKRA